MNITIQDAVAAYESGLVTSDEVLDFAWQNPNLTCDEIYEIQEMVNENFFSEGEGTEVAGLGEEPPDLSLIASYGYGLDQDSDHGGEWGRRTANKQHTTPLSFFDRVQESGNLQRSLQDNGSGEFTWDAPTHRLSEDER